MKARKRKTEFSGCAMAMAAAALVSGCADPNNPGLDTQLDSTADTADVLDTSPDVPDGDGVTDSADGTDVPDVPDVPDVEDGAEDTIGRICAYASECQNGLWCDGQETCPYGFCQPGPRVVCDDDLECTLDECNEATDTCDFTPDDSACDDSDPCTADSCDSLASICLHEATVCDDGVVCSLDTCDPLTGECDHAVGDEACDDGDDCTIDTCDTVADECSNALIDGDGDLVPPGSCGGTDCNDADGAIHPGALETCSDGTDQDCDGFDGDEGTCDCPTNVSAGGTFTGDTTSLSSANDGSCGYYYGGGANEAVHVLTLAAPATVTLETYGSVFDTLLYVRDAPCLTGTEIDCDDDGGIGVDSYLNLSLVAGTYYVFVDGYDIMESGSYTLTVTITP